MFMLFYILKPIVLPLLLAGGVMAAVAGLYHTVYAKGYEDSESDNLRLAVQEGLEASKRTVIALALVDNELEDERIQTRSLSDQVAALSAVPEDEGDAVCAWDAPLLWPD